MKASVFVGTSLDGFIARPNGALDFLDAAGGEPHGYEEFMASVDALVIGRHTFDTVLGFGGWAYGKKPVFVLSTRSLPPVPAGAVNFTASHNPPQYLGIKFSNPDGAPALPERTKKVEDRIEKLPEVPEPPEKAVARFDPKDFATRSAPICRMYDSPRFNASTFAGSLSKPVTSNPFSSNRRRGKT